jgi:hypothetical protein
MTTGHKVSLGKRVTIKDGRIVRKITFRTGISRRVQEAKAAREVKQWEGKLKTPGATRGASDEVLDADAEQSR